MKIINFDLRNRYCTLRVFSGTSRVCAKALQYFAQCLTSEDSSLVTNIKAHVNEAIEKPTDSTPTLKQTNGEFQCSKGFIILEI